MILVSYICLAVLCLIMTVVYALFNNKIGWQGLLVKGLTMLSLLVLALVSANLKSLINAISLYIPIGLSVLLVCECLYCVEIETKQRYIFSRVLQILGYLSIAFSAMALSEFNILAIIGGMLIGCGTGLICWGIKRYNKIEIILMEIISFVAIGMIIGFGLHSLLNSSHFISSLLVFVGGIILFIQKVLTTFSGNKKVIIIISNILYIIALISISSSLFFY